MIVEKTAWQTEELANVYINVVVSDTSDVLNDKEEEKDEE